MTRMPRPPARIARSAGALAVVGVLVTATALWTDLRPRVDRDFFFSSGSGTLQQAARIEQLFDRHAQIVLIARGDVGSERYLERLSDLEETLASLPGVVSSRSLASGPADLEDARESPLWRRLLLADDESASHLILLVRDPWPEDLVPRIEAAVARHGRPDFSLRVGGVPYTVAIMQRQLTRDFSVFGAVAVAGFGLAALVLFRSLRVAVGIVASCLAAVAITFLILQAAGTSLGLLSANLVTIVFVLTQSHLVFLTSNWCRRGQEEDGMRGVVPAMRETLRPSIGSMVTTLLGFGTLLFVEAKPLRELGLGGVVGGSVAFAVAYLLYPWFLAGSRPPDAGLDEPGTLERALSRRRPRLAGTLVGACLLVGLGLIRLDTDPSLLAYFDEDGEIHDALAYLDRHVGSTPFEMVLRRSDGGEILEGEHAYEQLWRAQRALEAEPEVGRVVSLPVVLAEGERAPLSFLLPKGLMLRLLESPLFDRVGESFVSEDRAHTLFALQMVEREREVTRVEVIERLRDVARRAGFEVPLVGGVYQLQGRLSEQVALSVAESLAALAILFTGIAWITVGSLRVGLVMTAVLALVPLGVFGGMGALGVPIDVVAAPAASIGLGLAADTLLHLAVAARRSAGGATGRGSIGSEAWNEGVRSQWRGIARASSIVALGFGLFALSGFPPTRRFGLAVAAAILLAALIALVALPALSTRARPRPPR